MQERSLEQTSSGVLAQLHDFSEPLQQQEQPETEPNRALFLVLGGQVVLLDSKSKKLETPVDELTSMPLPVLPPKRTPSFKNPGFANWHHHYHPSNSTRLTSLDGLAVRHSRVQLLPIASHHDRYHGIFEGPSVPRTNQERFGQIVLAVAGYVPPQAIDVHKDDPTEPVELSIRMRHRLQTSGELAVRGQNIIARFIKNHLIRQDFSHVEGSIIDEFLTSRDADRRWNLGHWLLAIASEIAVEPIKPVYQQALDEGLIKTPQTTLPNMVKSQVSTRKMSMKAIQALRRQLERQRV